MARRDAHEPVDGTSRLMGRPPPRGDRAGTDIKITGASLSTPRAAAIAGIAFALLLGTALVLMRISIPADPSDAGVWLDEPWRKTSVVVALNLIPFAGLAFLWFVGAVRDRIGDAEDRFFATVFLGTALLFVAMLFAAGALAGALVEANTQASPVIWQFGRHSTFLLVTIYAMRMAGAFTIVTTTIGRRLQILPRWLTIFGTLSGIVLLLTVESFAWVEILFPVWVLILSVHFLVHPPPGRDTPSA